MKVVTIWTEWDGFIGVAKDYPSAVKFLIVNGFLEGTTEVDFNEGKDWRWVEELFVDWQATILKWDIQKFNAFFDGVFLLTENTVFGA